MSDLFQFLQAGTGLTDADLFKIIQTAPRRYKVYEIPKRTGGMREIAQPSQEVKFLQRLLVDGFLKDLPVHECARAYRTGLSIKDNAQPHAGHTPILKMDFENFFPSIRAQDWISYCLRNKIFSRSDATLSSYIFFKKKKSERALRLSIGAPSSPILCNILLYDFDALVHQEALKRDISYTRYADDLTFSGQRIGMLKDMQRVVEIALRQTSVPTIKVNTKKTTFITTKTRRMVTGAILTNDGKISLGRDRKRLISAKVHRVHIGHSQDIDLEELSGELAFVNVIEPSFLNILERKYSTETVNIIKSKKEKK